MTIFLKYDISLHRLFQSDAQRGTTSAVSIDENTKSIFSGSGLRHLLELDICSIADLNHEILQFTLKRPEPGQCGPQELPHECDDTDFCVLGDAKPEICLTTLFEPHDGHVMSTGDDFQTRRVKRCLQSVQRNSNIGMIKSSVLRRDQVFDDGP